MTLATIMGLFLEVGLPISVAFIMFVMGLTLTLDDFKRVFVFPKAFMIGLLLQVIMLPIIGFLIAHIWHTYFGLSSLMAVGLIIIITCPGGITSNLLVYLGRGDSALSVSLTAVVSCFSLISLPLFVALAFQVFLNDSQSVELDLMKVVIGVFAISTVPLIFGMIIKAWKNDFAVRTQAAFKKTASILFTIIVVVVMIDNWDLFTENIGLLGPMVLVLCSTTMLIAASAASLFKLVDKQKRAIIFECGLQNTTIAIFISLTLLKSEEMMLPPAAYGILMYLPSAIYLALLYKKDKNAGTI